MSISNLIRRMSEAGAPPEAIAIAVEEIEALQLSLAARRTADRDRKRAQREREKSANVTGQSEDSHVMSRDPSLDKKVSQTLPKIKPIQAPLISPQKFQDAWNGMAAEHGLPKVEGVAGKRLRALKARIDDHGEEAVLRAISSVPKSPHWLGENGWLGNFDSLLRPENFQRMLEGAYAAAEPKQGRNPNEPVPLWKHLSDQRAGVA